jgi:hypothetical protein
MNDYEKEDDQASPGIGSIAIVFLMALLFAIPTAIASILQKITPLIPARSKNHGYFLRSRRKC